MQNKNKIKNEIGSPMLSLKAHIQAQIILSRLQAQNVHFRVEGHGRKNPGSGEIG